MLKNLADGECVLISFPVEAVLIFVKRSETLPLMPLPLSPTQLLADPVDRPQQPRSHGIDPEVATLEVIGTQVQVRVEACHFGEDSRVEERVEYQCPERIVPIRHDPVQLIREERGLRRGECPRLKWDQGCFECFEGWEYSWVGSGHCKIDGEEDYICAESEEIAVDTCEHDDLGDCQDGCHVWENDQVVVEAHV